MPNACTYPAVQCWEQNCVAVSDSGPLQKFLCKMTIQTIMDIPKMQGRGNGGGQHGYN